MPCFSVSIVNFEQVSAGWVGTNKDLLEERLESNLLPIPKKKLNVLAFYLNFFKVGLLYVCVCVCVFASIHRESFICLGLEFQGTDQRCCVEDVSFLCQVPSSLL